MEYNYNQTTPTYPEVKYYTYNNTNTTNNKLNCTVF